MFIFDNSWDNSKDILFFQLEREKVKEEREAKLKMEEMNAKLKKDEVL